MMAEFLDLVISVWFLILVDGDFMDIPDTPGCSIWSWKSHPKINFKQA